MIPAFGYCTNVHAGADLAQTRTNLEEYARAVKRQVSPDAPMGIGLWLSAAAARKLRADHQETDFAAWLSDAGLVPFTFNGFPFGDFHQARVKHQVYLPTWWEPARLDYTLDLVALQHALLPAGLEGSISTLPIAWGNPAPGHDKLAQAAAQLLRVAQHLAQLESKTGRLIHLCLEPEPGCVLQRGGDVVWFFEKYLLRKEDEAAVRRHLRVCHDICHAAVMFEEQAEVLEKFRAAGIGVGKIQVSSAVGLSLDRIPPDQRAAALKQLAGFGEDRYLHQTMVRNDPARPPTFHEDLPLALAAADQVNPSGEWRVHFHVPIYLRKFHFLEALQQPILDCLRLAKAQNTTNHFEIETYAWGVLPAELQKPELATGIAEELNWFREVAML